MSDERYNDYPIGQIAASMERVAQEGNNLAFFKWTCLGCGDRVTANEPFKVYQRALHEECGHITNTKATGGNFLIIAAI